MKLPFGIYRDLVQEAWRSSVETCGFLVCDEAGQMTIFWIRNVAENPINSFRFDPQTQVDALMYIAHNGMKVEAIWHTHPGGGLEPSKMDLAGASFQDPKVKHLIVAPTGIVRFWADPHATDGWQTEKVEPC